MTDYATQKLTQYRTDKDVFFRECLVIRDHDSAKLLPFSMNRGQRILHNVIEKQKAEFGRVRILLLKSRRFGGSTYVAGRSYANTSLNFNRNAFIVGHEEESTNTLFAMPKLFQEKNPIAPSTLSSNAKELIFDNKSGTGLKSGYRLATARNLSAGRSQGIHYLHASEEAFWPSGAEELLLGLFQCVPDSGDTEIIRESTANGYGDTFQVDVNKAYCEGRYPYYEQDGRVFAWKNPKFDWILVFIPWFDIEKYSKDFESESVKEIFDKKISEKVFDKDNLEWVESDSSRLKRKFNLSLEQLHWREWAIENKCNGSIDKFHQEYPSTVEEAFLSVGSNVFPKHLCDSLQEQCPGPIGMGDVYRLGGKTRLKRNKHGNFTVWEQKEDGESYFITVDCAGGKKEGVQKGKEPDKTNIDVWNHRTGNQAAQWNGHIPYDLIGDMVSMIGELYQTGYGKNAILPTACVELINHGFTAVADLKRLKYPQYGNVGSEPGWQTNRRTKPQMIDSLYKAARDSELKINSKETVSEMRTYVEDNGKFNAAQGCNDDRVITAAMASELVRVLPRKYGKKKNTVGFSNFKRSNESEATYQEYYA